MSRLLLTLAFLLPAVGIVAQEPPPEPPPESAPESAPESEPTTQRENADEPRSVVPPEGEEDFLSFGNDTEDGVDPASGGDAPSSSGDTARDAPPQNRPEVVRARLRGEVGHRHVRGLKRLRKGAARGEISRQGDWIAFDQPTELGVRGLYVGQLGDPAGSPGRCLSCENSAVRKKSVLAPTWHPSGKVLVALVQGPARKLDLDIAQLATPARGLHSELWAFALDGRDAWGLTRVVPQGGAVLDPAFSFEGNRLAWSERVSTHEGGRWGDWVVRVGEFRVKRGLPRLGDVQTYEVGSGAGLVIVEGFTQDDDGLWLTVSSAPGAGTPEAGTPGAGTPESNARGPRIGRLDLESGEFQPLPGLGTRNEGISGVPHGDRRVWLTDRDLDLPDRLPRINELWLMSESGRSQERLTYFNDPRSRDPLGEAWIADTSWSTDGRRLLLHILTPGLPGQLEEGLYLLELSPDLGRR
jgi:hypothetical protein